jgi:hypothetical protein
VARGVGCVEDVSGKRRMNGREGGRLGVMVASTIPEKSGPINGRSYH